MASPSIRLTLPSASLFKLPPASLPTIVPPPTSDFIYAPKYEIPPKLYNNLLSVAYPISIALVYTAAVTYFNRLNRQRGNKPWAFSKTRAFYWGVVAHNLLLAAYSAWTLKGMLQALQHSWPGLLGESGLVGVVDAMCKMQGPRGYGNGVFFNSTTNIWSAPSHLVNLTPKGTPDVTDLGRLWNEGLAYYGWVFYLSKFYEVLDTAIILAKGKTSSPLQTFHHAGAMLCMWAGIRYMSPPIWLFVLLNSGIHTLMYTYYALASLAVPVPQSIKRLLTSMQITQIAVGGTYALAHLFVSYSVPVSIPRKVIPSVASAVSAASSVASSAATSIATAASSAGIGNIIRKVALRAAGEEGLAENVPLADHPKILKNPLKGATLEQIVWDTENEMVPCIDTSGQAFAILLNLLYFLPLTYLFINFFARSYTGRTSSKTKHPTHSSLLGKVSRDATKGVQRETQEEPLPLPEQTQSVANAARDAAEKFVDELENEAVGDREVVDLDKPEPAQNGGVSTTQGEQPSTPADEEANAEKTKPEESVRNKAKEAAEQEETKAEEEKVAEEAKMAEIAHKQDESRKAEQSKKEQAEKEKRKQEQEESRKMEEAKKEKAEKEATEKAEAAKRQEESTKAEEAEKTKAADEAAKEGDRQPKTNEEEQQPENRESAKDNGKKANVDMDNGQTENVPDDEDDDMVNVEPVTKENTTEPNPAINGKSKKPTDDVNDDSTAESSDKEKDTESNVTTDDDASKEDDDNGKDSPESPLVVDGGPNMSAVLVSGDIEKP